jgi:hypothetical protein
MQHVLKIQKISFLLKYKKKSVGRFPNLCIHHAGLYKRLSTNVNSQTHKYQYSECPHPAHAVPLFQKTENWCARRGHSITGIMLFTKEGKKQLLPLYWIHSHATSHSINKCEKLRLFHAGHCHDIHTVNLSVTALQKVFSTMADNSWNVALLISRS